MTAVVFYFQVHQPYRLRRFRTFDIGGGSAYFDDELNKRAWRDTIPRFAHSPAALDRGRYERFAAFLKQQGLVKATPPLDTFAVELMP